MIRMIIADDEPVITRGLSILVDWQSLGIRVDGIYSDGESAMEAILKQKPDIALLDISMPGMDGIQILKSIHDLQLAVKVIFISGFQDFSYARNAVTYGAVDYLLKPVIKEELLRAVEKALGTGILPAMETGALPASSGSVSPADDAAWVPVLATVLLPPEATPQEVKLMRFAWKSFLEEYMSEHDRGIVYIAGEDLFAVFRVTGGEDTRDMLRDVCRAAGSHVRGTPGFIVGERIHSLSDMPDAILTCVGRKGELFFAEADGCVILEPAAVADSAEAMTELTRRRDRMIDNILAMKRDSFSQDFAQFSASLVRASAGRKDDAGFYYCSTARLIEDRMREHHIAVQSADTKELLERARECASFAEMREWFRGHYEGYIEQLHSSAVSAGKKDIARIKEYIDQHYRENLTLEVMAGEFYMNSYYFSAWFKKQTGTNFKEYLSYIRLQHAISLLLTTNMKTYEIASEVGFGDARAFTEAFSRQYGETPGSYRKRVRTES